jgi:hypothetical protein
MEPAKIVAQLCTPLADGMDKDAVADACRRLLIATFQQAVRDWLAWTARLDDGVSLDDDARRELRRNLIEVTDWLWGRRRCAFSIELVGAVLNFDPRELISSLNQHRAAMAEGRGRLQIPQVADRDQASPSEGVGPRRHRRKGI